MADRKSVVQGKSVDLGGRRIIKKKFFQAEDGIRDIKIRDWSSDGCSSDLLDYVIPGNDDAIRAVKLIVSKMADAVIEAKQGAIDVDTEEAPVEEVEA